MCVCERERERERESERESERETEIKNLNEKLEIEKWLISGSNLLTYNRINIFYFA